MTRVDRKPSLQSTLHKAKCRISSMCITHVLANKQFVPHKCGHQSIHHNNAPGTTTSCDGGALLTTQGTHICLILSFILRGGWVAFISPNMRRNMVPRSITRVTDPPPNAKMREMQQNTHRWVQLIRAATLDVPNQTPVPQLSKQMLNVCPKPPMHIIVRLLWGCERSILSSNESKSRANPYPQLERGRSVSPTGKGPCKKHGLGLCIKSGPNRCLVRARRTDAPPLVTTKCSVTPARLSHMLSDLRSTSSLHGPLLATNARLEWSGHRRAERHVCPLVVTQ